MLTLKEFIQFIFWFVIICVICAWLGSQLGTGGYEYAPTDDYQNQSIF